MPAPDQTVAETPTPRVNEFATGMYNQSCAAAAYGGHDISPEEGYGMALDFARTLERELAAARAALRGADNCMHNTDAALMWRDAHAAAIERARKG